MGGQEKGKQEGWKWLMQGNVLRGKMEARKSAWSRQESSRVRQKCKKWVTAAAERLHGEDEEVSEAAFPTRLHP